MKGYETVPNALSRNANLSLGARALYPVLKNLAYLAGRRDEEDVVELPSLAEIAGVLGVSETTVRGYVRELSATGWIDVARASRRAPQRYAIWDSPQDASPRESADSGALSPRESADSGGRASSIEDRGKTEGAIAPSRAAPPPAVRVGGRNLAFDALRAVSEIPEGSPRVREVAAALNGTRTVGPGIRTLAWRERPAWVQGAESFERFVADEVVRRADAYRRAFPGLTLTPTALAKWWVEVEARARAREEAGRGERGLSPEEIASGAWRRL